MEILQSGEFWAVMAGLLWAVAVILFRLAGEDIPPLTMNLFKGVVAFVVFVPFLVVTSDALVPDFPAETWLRLVLSGVIGVTVADTLFFAALNRLGAGLNAVVSCLYFPVLAALAALVLGDHISSVTIIGAGLVIAGIVIGSVGSSDARGGQEARTDAGVTDAAAAEGRPVLPIRSRRDLVTGLVFGVIGVLALTTSVIMVAGILREEPVVWTTTVRLVAGTVAVAPFVLLGRERRVAARLFKPSPLWRYALPAAVLGGALAMLAWIQGFALTDISTAASLNQLSTIYVFVLASLVLKEPVTRGRAVAVGAAFIGAILVIVAV
jgi:drug/metabolite transporter (DMT)-like permease